LVEQQLAACINIIDKIRSIYRWNGKIETGNEALLLIKSAASKFSEINRSIRKLHPYENPEVIALNVTGGAMEYLNWVIGEVNPPGSPPQ
jgi:periplasmic divalent cation tolerance protein